MKIAILGYGKMGKAIESIASQRGHDIVLKVNIDNLHDLTAQNLKAADVAIEFSGPESAVHNLKLCFDAGVPVVCGSTGWLMHLPEVEAYRQQHKAGFLHASNFSVGVNILFEVNKLLARLMCHHAEYEVTITETHHTAKLDSPSGTAITLAEQINQAQPRHKGWYNITDDVQVDHADRGIPILSKRIDPAPGTHAIEYKSAIDDILLVHTAHSRTGFALGAVLAAEFMHGKKGSHTMADVLKAKLTV
ncbi:MAG: 4-hydroxy-tetrahydrodipicolinate reductase [Bacteroidetes bacterium]|nr:MAG: 4-hydroxy-tetrahydrodipicolinate reductase [Bacteroidota bacterium]